ncbi:hypothetical protein ScPMuIL_012953 [Solemya velum]
MVRMKYDQVIYCKKIGVIQWQMFFGSEGRRTPLYKPGLTSEVVGDVLEKRQSPPHEVVGDIIETSSGHRTSAQSDISSLLGPGRSASQHSAHSSTRSTPQRDLISFHSSQEKLYPQLSGSDRNSSHGSNEHHSLENIDDRPLSLSSEQELTQYFDQGDRRTSEQKTDFQTAPVVSSTYQPITTQMIRSTERPSSTTSLPVITTRQRLQAEKRSMTPDNHIRVPITASPLLKGGGDSYTHTRPASASSRASSRPITPVANMLLNNGYGEDHAHRLTDLEDTVTSLRKLLSAREHEVHDLTDKLKDVHNINQMLRTEIGNVQSERADNSQGRMQELDNKLTQCLNEKDILAAEVVKLQDELQDIRSHQASRERRLSGRSDDSTPLNTYNPNSPTTLQRKIDDLESHIMDLQEANESAVTSLNSAERRFHELQAENNSLRVDKTGRREIEEENTKLREQIFDLKKQKNFNYGDSEHRKEIELQQLHEDYKGLRDRNFQLHESNMKLKDEMRELRRALERVTQRDTGTKYKEEMRTKTQETFMRNEKDQFQESGYKMERVQNHTRPSITASMPVGLKHSYTRSEYIPQSPKEEHPKQTRRDLLRTQGEHIAVGRSAQRSVPDGSNDDNERTVDSSNSSYERAITPERKRYEKSNLIDKNSFDGSVLSRRSRYDPVPYTHKHSISYERKYKHYAPLERSYDHNIQQQKWHDGQKNLDRQGYERPEMTERTLPIYNTNLSRSKSEKMGLDKITPSDKYSLNLRHRRLSADREYQSLNTSQIDTDRIHSTPALERSRERRDSASSERSDSTLVLMSGYGRPPLSIPTKRHNYTDSDETRGYPNYESSRPISDDTEDNSDTATDILVNARVSPIETSSAQLSRRRYRRDSIGSTSEVSVSSYSDIDEQLIASMRKRSKSADGREAFSRRTPTGSHGRGSQQGAAPMSMPTSPASGFRSITLRPLATQHNMGSLSTSCGSLRSLTQGMKPFAPRTPGDIEISDVVKFSRQGGKLSQGMVKFIGHLPGRSDIYLGVELDKDDGKHDGTFEDIRYFKCKPNKGVFVAFNKVVMAWSPY